MYLEHIRIKNYKNLSDIDLTVSSKINCLVGKNGAGKTNFLDAVYFISNTRSYFNHIDSQNIAYSEDYFFIEANFLKKQDKNTVTASFSSEKGKIFKLNSKKQKKLSDHYGLFPVVIITPYDINLILDGSELRRNFVDSIISLYNKEYLSDLINYKKILQQRNALLKKFAENRIFDEEMLSMFDYKIIELSPKIHKQRQIFIEDFKDLFQKYYTEISQSEEKVDIRYKSNLNDENIEVLLKNNLRKDSFLMRTSVGIHKDDLTFLINKNSLKKSGSQGQQKTFLTALKFAQSDFLMKHTGIRPILLLDDIFDKLDTYRVQNVVKLVANNHFGQIFITHTDLDKLEQILAPVDVDYSIFDVDSGKMKLSIKNLND